MVKTPFPLSCLVIILFLLAMVPGCSNITPFTTPNSSSSTVTVLAAETFLADIAQNVAGDRIKIDDLMPIGADPHSYEPTPGDVAKITSSNLFIINGTGFEESIEKLLAQRSGERQIIEASAGLTPRSAREGETGVMSDADIVDAICTDNTEHQVQQTASGANQISASELSGEEGFFNISLLNQSDGTYSGYVKYTTDETGPFWIATSAGRISVSIQETTTPVELVKSLTLQCGEIKQANIVELKKEQLYVIALEDFKSDQVTLLIGPVGGHHHEEDPHFWLAPNNVIKYVENIRDGLSQIDPAGAQVYKENATEYIAKLKELDGWITEQVGQIPATQRLLVTNHESFGYFADRYGFKIVGTIVPSVSTEASPSAQQVARLVDHIRATGAKAIFLETGTNPMIAQQVARETGSKVVTDLYTHSVSDSTGAAPTYIDMMKYNVRAIVDALK